MGQLDLRLRKLGRVPPITQSATTRRRSSVQVPCPIVSATSTHRSSILSGIFWVIAENYEKAARHFLPSSPYVYVIACLRRQRALCLNRTRE